MLGRAQVEEGDRHSHQVELRVDGDMEHWCRGARGQALGQDLGGSHLVGAKEGREEEDEESEGKWIEKAKQDEGILKQREDMTGQRWMGLVSVLGCCSGQSMGRTCHCARRQPKDGPTDWCATRGQRLRHGQRTLGELTSGENSKIRCEAFFGSCVCSTARRGA